MMFIPSIKNGAMLLDIDRCPENGLYRALGIVWGMLLRKKNRLEETVKESVYLCLTSDTPVTPPVTRAWRMALCHRLTGLFECPCDMPVTP